MKKLTSSDLKNFEGYKHRDEMIKRSNFEVWIDDNGYLTATSFGWWKILHNKNGLYFFNDYCYSSYTSRHQSKLRAILSRLGIDYISVSYSGHGYVNSLGKSVVNELGGYSKNTLQNVSIEGILEDKIKLLYSYENQAAKLVNNKNYASNLSRLEDSFNYTLKDIRTIAGVLKISEDKLDKMLVSALDKQTETMLDGIIEKHNYTVLKRELTAQNQSLEAIAI